MIENVYSRRLYVKKKGTKKEENCKNLENSRNVGCFQKALGNFRKERRKRVKRRGGDRWIIKRKIVRLQREGRMNN